MKQPRAIASNIGKRESLLKAVDAPLRLFALVVLVVEAIVLGSALKADPQNQAILYWGALSIAVLTILVVAGIAVSRPEALQGQSPVNLEALGDSLSEDIWFSMDGALANLQSESEQAEAWVLLMTTVTRKRPGELQQVQTLRDGLVEGIKARAGRGQPSLQKTIAKLEMDARRSNSNE